MQSLADLMATLPQTGQVAWIGVRPGRRESLLSLEQVRAAVDTGLAGDHYGKRGGKRQVTLIQAEHLAAVSSMLGGIEVTPAIVRRNLVVSGINLLALKGRQFQVGEAILEYTGPCQPCSLMEELLGPGAYNAMRGHGGITAVVSGSGIIHVGDAVMALPENSSAP